jgi:hypothetical protein
LKCSRPFLRTGHRLLRLINQNKFRVDLVNDKLNPVNVFGNKKKLTKGLTKVPERVIVSPVEYINPEETMQIQNDERMTVPEIAALVGVTEQAVRYWAKRGLYLNWQRSVNNRVFALRPEVEELARGYIGSDRRRESAVNQ